MLLTQPSTRHSQVLTKDLFYVSYLLTCGMTVKDIILDDQSHRGKAVFVVQGENIGRYELEYNKGDVTVNLLELKETMKRVKDLMFDFLRSKQCYENHQKVY